MYGTKSSVTPAKASSSTMRSSDWVLVRCRTSSKSIILRWPPDRPAVNTPAMVPPILTPGLYDSFFFPSAACSLSTLSEYRFQYGSCSGSNLGMFDEFSFVNTDG
eukprot:scaffold32676_cov61-Phaeocystis_antarctica.AAC.2